ncbi:nuclear receptor 2C2-associated protein-like isoform X2 [Phymastichus coffea]|uniref:nuclear receptor 2C2-associated protein-like isoform X2 n=1 Tax=Phymastichus coffea TaxID=108790 RepID=UPI00273BA9CE|nr:nuclear receptor 2C2-associated protein-like isoform X2 [Phymastichus coffea]
MSNIACLLMACQLAKQKFECRVSSVLNKNVKSYGKQFMFDDESETCWNSDSGSPQWVFIKFDQEVELSCIKIQFQGGFAGKKCWIEAGSDLKNLDYIQDIFPEDINLLQTFNLDFSKKASAFKIIFDSSTDFFGRIIIYKLSLS